MRTTSSTDPAAAAAAPAFAAPTLSSSATITQKPSAHGALAPLRRRGTTESARAAASSKAVLFGAPGTGSGPLLPATYPTRRAEPLRARVPRTPAVPHAAPDAEVEMAAPRPTAGAEARHGAAVDDGGAEALPPARQVPVPAHAAQSEAVKPYSDSDVRETSGRVHGAGLQGGGAGNGSSSSSAFVIAASGAVAVADDGPLGSGGAGDGSTPGTDELGGEAAGTSAPPQSFTLEDIEQAKLIEYKEMFDSIDNDGGGSIDTGELRKVFTAFGIDLTEQEFEAILGELDDDGGGSIDFEEFAVCMHGLLHREDNGEVVDVSYAPEQDVKALQWYESWPALKHTLWEMMDDPGSSGTARLVSMVIMSLISLSVVAFIAESVPALHRRPDTEAAFHSIEILCVAVFTVEYVLRAVGAPSFRSFVVEPLNVIDLVAVLPFYLEAAFTVGGAQGSAVIRASRLVRVFRLFKFSRYLGWLAVFRNTLMSSGPPLAMIIFVISIAVVFFSTVAYTIERGEWLPDERIYVVPDSGGVRSEFESIPGTFYWCVISLSTVGYGDIVPLSTGGRLLGAVIGMSGVLILAVPIATISSNFAAEYARMERSQAIVAEQEAKVAAADEKLQRGGSVRAPSPSAASLNAHSGRSLSRVDSTAASDTQRSPRRRARQYRPGSAADVEAFLHSAEELVGDNSRRLHKWWKARETRNRDALTTELGEFVEDLRLDRDAYALRVFERMSAAGLAPWMSRAERDAMAAAVAARYDVNDVNYRPPPVPSAF